MKKAISIREIYHNFLPELYITKENSDFYIPLYENDLRRFKTDLIEDPTNKSSFFIAGQSGNGKSTVLKMLDSKYEDLNNKFEFKYLGGKDIFVYEDVNIVDLLLMIGSSLIKDDKELQKKYFEQLDKLQNISNGTLNIQTIEEQSNDLSASFGSKLNISLNFLNIFKSNSTLEAQYKQNDTLREISRKVFKTKESELVDLINEIILDYKISKNDKKELLIIIDDLEKKEDIDKLFLKDLHFLDGINMVKIITMPIYLRRTQAFSNKNVREFALKLNDFDGEANNNDIQLLKDVILKRLEKKDLIEEDTINNAVLNSGGNLRQLMQLIKISANEALTFEAQYISEKELDYAIEFIQRGLSSVVMSNQTILKEILNNKTLKDDNDDNLKKLGIVIKMGLVFAYFNGKIWYEINPIIKDILKSYLNNSNG